MAEQDYSFRRPSKRPVGRKAVDRILHVDEDEQKFESFDNWKFSTFRTFLEKYLIAGEGKLDLSLADAIRNNITFFQNLRLEIQQRHKSFEESFARPIVSVQPKQQSTRIMPVTRHQIARSQSKAVSLQKTPTQKTTPKEKPTSKSRNQSHHDDYKHFTSQTIWQLTQKFFGTVPTPETYKKYMKGMEVSPSNVPLGPHYSIALNQKLKKRFNNESIALVVPTAVASTSYIGSVPIVPLHRALAAFVPVSDIEVNAKADVETVQPVPSSTPGEGEHPGPVTNLIDFDIDEDETTFPAGQPGTSQYSKLSFDEKLSLEFASVGLVPDKIGVGQTDNEVMNDILILEEEFKRSAEQTNQLREMIETKLIERQKELQEKIEKTKLWVQMIEKAEKENKAKPKQKNRDKLV